MQFVPSPLNTIVLIDGHNMLQRAAHGYPVTIRNSRGDDVTLLFGFMTLVRASLKSISITARVAVVFDGPRGADRRRRRWAKYKPFAGGGDLLAPYLPDIRRLCELASVTFIQHQESEADDVIAQIVAVHHQASNIYIVSTDQDFYALLSTPGVTVVNPVKKADQRNVTSEDVRRRFDIPCERWVEYKSLVGDPADGVPGVRGVGPRRACALLEKGSLSEIVRLGVVSSDVLLWRDILLFEDVSLGAELDAITETKSYLYREFPSAELLLRRAGIW